MPNYHAKDESEAWPDGVLDKMDSIREERLRLIAEKRAKRIEAEHARVAEEQVRLAEQHLQFLARPNPAPQPQPFGVSDLGAEALVCEWMRHLGVMDAEVTRSSRDGGIDVLSSEWAAQVKNYAGSVTVNSVRELFGVSQSMGRRSVFFTSGVVTEDGLEFANRVQMPVIQYDAVEGLIRGINELGRVAVAEGFAGLLSDGGDA